MARRDLAVACVALLTVTAGCSGVFGGEGTPSREPYDVDPTPTVTATPTGTATGTATSPVRASRAYRAAVENHTRRVRAIGNVTLRRTQRSGRVVGNASPDPVTTVLKGDFDADRYAFGRPPENGSGEFTVLSYQNGTTWYRRVESGGNVTYVEATGSGGAAAFTPEGYAFTTVRYLGNRPLEFPLERDGTVWSDGEVMARFTTSDPGPFRGTYTELWRVTSFHATALVDDRGIVREFTYAIRGRTYTNETYVESERVVVTDLGRTTVDTPDGRSNATSTP